MYHSLCLILTLPSRSPLPLGETGLASDFSASVGPRHRAEVAQTLAVV